MKESLSRKSPRFFVINPVNDRRAETRFESEEHVKVKNLRTHQVSSGTAFDIGHFGLRLEASREYSIGDHLQIEFSGRAENIGCWGQVAWSESRGEKDASNSGVAMNPGFGIVDGPESWKRMKGSKPKKDRRQKLR